MLLFMKKRMKTKDPEENHWVEVPCPHITYEDTVEEHVIVERGSNGKDYSKKQKVTTGLGSLVIHVPNIPSDITQNIVEWRYEQIRYWARFARAGIDKFTVEWRGNFTVRLENGYGGIEFKAQSGAELTPLRKVLMRHIAKSEVGEEPPYQIRVSYQGMKAFYTCEPRDNKAAADPEAPNCGFCGEPMVRALVPAGHVRNEGQKYWKCQADGCGFELADPPLITPPPAPLAFKDDYATKGLGALVELCAERGIAYAGKEKSDLIILLRKHDETQTLAGAT